MLILVEEIVFLLIITISLNAWRFSSNLPSMIYPLPMSLIIPIEISFWINVVH